MRPGPLLGLLLACCSATPLEPAAEPRAADASLIAVRVRAIPPFEQRLHGPIRAAWFVRFEEGADPAEGREVLRSNFWGGGLIYLLNAKPGHYAVVAVEERSEGRTIPTYLATESVRRHTVEVRPGDWALMGNYAVHQGKALDNMDQAQRAFRHRVYPPARRKTGISGTFGGLHEYHGYRVEVRRDEPTLAAQLRDASGELKRAGWVSPPR